MAAPNPVTDLTVDGEEGTPIVDLEWDHDGVDLDRFEVLTRLSGDTRWDSVLMDEASTFGTGPYAVTITGTEDQEFAVAALNADGERSS